MMNCKKVIVIMAIAWILVMPFFSFLPNTRAQSQPTLSLDPSQVAATSTSDSFTIDLKIGGVTNLWGWSAIVTWDTQYLTMAKAPTQGNFFNQDDHQTTFIAAFNQTTGMLKGSISEAGLDSNAQSGDGTLVTLTFKVLKPIVSTLVNVNVTSLLTNQTNGAGGAALYTTSISPFPASTYASTSVSYIPTNGIPVPDAGENQTVNQHTTVILNASKTLPQDSSQNYVWTFFDNESRTLTGMVTSYAFDWPGVTIVTLTVSNANGSASATIGITVKDTTPPVPKITIGGYSSGQNLPVNTLIRFYGNESYDPYNLTWVSNWNFGDDSHSSMVDSYHTYANSGTYTVTLNVTNSAGMSAVATRQVVVGDGSSDLSPTDTPISSPSESPSDTTSPTTSPNSQGNTSEQTSFSLPPTVLYPLIFVTVFALGGSAFWLRKRT